MLRSSPPYNMLIAKIRKLRRLRMRGERTVFSVFGATKLHTKAPTGELTGARFNYMKCICQWNFKVPWSQSTCRRMLIRRLRNTHFFAICRRNAFILATLTRGW